MVYNFFWKKLFFLGFLITMLFYAEAVFAANPTSLLIPTNIILDPGSLYTPWGGCGPVDSNCYTIKKTSSTLQNKNNKTILTQNSNNDSSVIKNIRSFSNSNTAINNSTLLSALRNLFTVGLPNDLLSKLQGPVGPVGPKGDSGLNIGGGYTPIPVNYAPMGTIPSSNNFSGGTVLSATFLSAKEFTTGKANITDTATIATLNVSKNSTITGNLSVGGTTTSVGSTTLATGIDTINTFGSGASSINTIGSEITPGALTLHGATSLDNSLLVTGQVTFTKIPTLAHAFTTWPAGTSNVSDSTVYINPDTAVADTNLLGVAVGGSVKFLVDAEGDIYGNNMILTGSVTQGNTSVENLTVGGNTILGDAGTDIVTIHGATTLDNTFSQTGVYTFSTGTGNISLNGAATYTTLSGGNITDSALTAGRVTFAGTAGLLVDDADLTFLTDTLSATKILSNLFNGLAITNNGTNTLNITAGKTLTISDSTTLATNSITLAGGEVITFSATNALSLLTTGATSITLPTSGTLYGTATDSITSLQLLSSLSDETGTDAL
ncbi:hypothetical protein COX93_02005, partial [Candidatus Nomurabacteria bacterium CG_4_10_14_0_2_um_filter_30_12]